MKSAVPKLDDETRAYRYHLYLIDTEGDEHWLSASDDKMVAEYCAFKALRGRGYEIKAIEKLISGQVVAGAKLLTQERCDAVST